MELVVITGPSYEVALPRVQKALELYDGVELRLDLFRESSLEKLKHLREIAQKKICLFTLRHCRQGGGFSGSPEEQKELIKSYISLSPDYFDLEFDTDPSFLSYLSENFPHTQLMLSYHDFQSLPRNLTKILGKMKNPHAHAYKISGFARSESDAYRMLKFIQTQTSLGENFTGICMGEEGKITRTDGIKAGNIFNYRILHQTDLVAPGLDFA